MLTWTDSVFNALNLTSSSLSVLSGQTHAVPSSHQDLRFSLAQPEVWSLHYVCFQVNWKEIQRFPPAEGWAGRVPLSGASRWLSGFVVLDRRRGDSDEVQRTGKVPVLVALPPLPSRAQGARFESRRSELHPALERPRSPINIRSVPVTHDNSHPSLRYAP